MIGVPRDVGVDKSPDRLRPDLAPSEGSPGQQHMSEQPREGAAEPALGRHLESPLGTVCDLGREDAAGHLSEKPLAGQAPGS